MSLQKIATADHGKHHHALQKKIVAKEGDPKGRTSWKAAEAGGDSKFTFVLLTVENMRNITNAKRASNTTMPGENDDWGEGLWRHVHLLLPIAKSIAANTTAIAGTIANTMTTTFTPTPTPTPTPSPPTTTTTNTTATTATTNYQLPLLVATTISTNARTSIDLGHFFPGADI